MVGCCVACGLQAVDARKAFREKSILMLTIWFVVAFVVGAGSIVAVWLVCSSNVSGFQDKIDGLVQAGYRLSTFQVSAWTSLACSSAHTRAC